MRGAQRGDPRAMDALVRELSGYVGRICGAIALDDGDDAAQETFIAVLRSIRSLREPAALHGWVRRIAVREAVRVAKRRPVAVDVQGLDGIDERALDSSTALEVREALAALSPEHRAVLVLRDLDGFTEAEVAELLCLPEGTVKSRLHRARRAFATRWAP